jgi:hypothetical protein
MSDSYQAVYDAVRSRISNANMGGAVENVLREANLSHYAEMAYRAAQETAWEAQRPSVLFRPAVMIDGNKWCALYGDDLQNGVAGFGDSPALAMADFDANWFAKLNLPAKACSA